jgi:GTPase SAR1 family protein
VNLPVILCANKSDLYPDVEAEKEMMPIMMEFKEIDSCIRASAKELWNINEVCSRPGYWRHAHRPADSCFICANEQ